MKIGTLESIFLIIFSIVCDIINIVLVVLVIGLIANTLINVFLGLVFILWFYIRPHLTTADEEGTDPTDQFIEDEKERLKKLYRQRTEDGKSVGSEIASSTEDLAEKQVGRAGEEIGGRIIEKETGQLAGRTLAQTGEKVATQVAGRTAVQTAEKVVARTGEKAAVGIISRILGTTFVAKLIPFFNFLPLWTISTVLLLRQSKKEQKAIEDAKTDN